MPSAKPRWGGKIARRLAYDPRRVSCGNPILGGPFLSPLNPMPIDSRVFLPYAFLPTMRDGNEADQTFCSAERARRSESRGRSRNGGAGARSRHGLVGAKPLGGGRAQPCRDRAGFGVWNAPVVP